MRIPTAKTIGDFVLDSQLRRNVVRGSHKRAQGMQQDVYHTREVLTADSAVYELSIADVLCTGRFENDRSYSQTVCVREAAQLEDLVWTTYEIDMLIEITQVSKSDARFERSMQRRQGAVGCRGKTCIRSIRGHGRARGNPLSCWRTNSSASSNARLQICVVALLFLQPEIRSIVLVPSAHVIGRWAEAFSRFSER